MTDAPVLVSRDGPVARITLNRPQLHNAFDEALIAGLAVLDIHPTVPESERLWMLNSVAVPKGVDDRAIRGRLLGRHGIEIGGGLGSLAGKIWRIGLMGESSRVQSVRRLLACLAIELRSSRTNQAIDAADQCV